MQSLQTAGRGLSRASPASSKPQAFKAHVVTNRNVVAYAPSKPAVQKLAVHCQAAAAEAVEQTAAAPARKPTLHSQQAPETYAIVEISGKQMFVEPGKWYTTNRLKLAPMYMPGMAMMSAGASMHTLKFSHAFAACENFKGVEVGDTIRLGRVLAHKVAGEFKVGQPYLEGVSVEAEILEELRGPKIIVYKMKPKKHYRRKNGHRQELTKFRVTKLA